MPHYNRTQYENSTVPWYRPNKGMRVSSVGVVIAEMRSCLGAGGASALDRALRRDRQADQERCSWPLVWLGPQPAAMRLNDGARDGQSHAHPVGFSGVKRLKQPLHLSRFETGARILHAKPGLRNPVVYFTSSANYQDTAGATLTADATFDLAKIANVSTAKIGDRVHYMITVSVIEGTTPSLVLHAIDDDVASTRSAEFVARNIDAREVRTVLYRESYHILTMDNDRDAVADETIGFFRRHGARTSGPESWEERLGLTLPDRVAEV